VKQVLADAGVGSGVFYPLGLHLQECFRYLGYRAGELPETERASQEVLALPIYPELTDAQLEHVAQALRAATH
jgi:dTDP-4-amino-4,6-dideoxygalactose transaminase